MYIEFREEEKIRKIELINLGIWGYEHPKHSVLIWINLSYFFGVDNILDSYIINAISYFDLSDFIFKQYPNNDVDEMIKNFSSIRYVIEFTAKGENGIILIRNNFNTYSQSEFKDKKVIDMRKKFKEISRKK